MTSQRFATPSTQAPPSTPGSLRLRDVLAALAISAASSHAQTNLPTPFLNAQPTAAYRAAVLRFMLAEANAYASALDLPEEVPITEKSIREQAISSPRAATRFGALGSFRTARFSYGFGKGTRLSYLTRLPEQASNKPLYDRLKPWATDPAQLDTNAACASALRLLMKAFVDVDSLSRVARPEVHATTVLGMTTSIYSIEWRRAGSPIAQAIIAGDKPEVWSLRVEDPQFILRKPFRVESPDGPPQIPQ